MTLSRSRFTPVLSLMLSACAAPAFAQAGLPFVQLDTEIVSLDLALEELLPVGPGGSLVLTRVTLTEATDHNSSRSNKTSNAAPVSPPPPIDPDQLAGQKMDFTSEIDLQFDLFLEDIDPDNSFDQSIAASPNGSTVESALLAAGPSFNFSIASDDICPRGCVLEAPVGSHNGHVTVLKIAFGGGGGGGGFDLDLQPQGIDLSLTPGTSLYRELPNGEVEHTVDVTMALTGSLNGSPVFVGSELSGSMVERGTFVNAIVPEPFAAALASLGAVVVLPRRGARSARQA